MTVKFVDNQQKSWGGARITDVIDKLLACTRDLKRGKREIQQRPELRAKPKAQRLEVCV